MNELEIKKISERFFVESLKNFENGDKDNVVVLILLSRLLEARKPKEDVHRDIDVIIDSDEKFSAYSRKLSNLLQPKKASVWMNILSKATTVAGGVFVGEAAFGLADGIKLAGSILSFLTLVMNEGTLVEFNEQDAKILLAISRIGKTFSKAELLGEIKNLNKEFPGKFDIEMRLIERSLKKLIKYRVLRDLQDDIYEVIEDINAPDK